MNPSLTLEQAINLVEQAEITDKVVLIGLRSTTSKYGEYDDTLALLIPDGYIEWKGNTLPSSWVPGIAKTLPGKYLYAKGLHGINHFAQIEAALGKAKRDDVEKYLTANLPQGLDYPYVLKDAKNNPLIIPYPAFRQHGPVTLIRDGQTESETEKDPSKFPFIDLHRGGWNGTSSAGCQTWYPDHWPQARKMGYGAMDKYGQETIWYLLHQM